MRVREADERGMTLLEVLVATAILAVAIVVALTVYDASRKAFAKGENATEQQESVRIAFDLMTSQIRMLGLNANPDGDLNRPDEQLEGALDRAMIFRGDFDPSDPHLGGGAFRTVSTGNDEIVAYVLSKPDGTGPDTITFEADVSESPRDGDVEPVSIGNVVLDPTSPPYTLYRVTLNNDSATYGSPGFLVRIPVVENVRDLHFTYYDTAGTFKDPSATIPETPASKAARSGLTRVNVSLVGMTRQQDLGYFDPSDAEAPHYRKFELKGDVTPRNLRLKGIQDLNADVTPPGKPATPTLIPGHCAGLLVSWAGNPVSEGVTQYRVNWGPNNGEVSGSRNLSGAPVFLDQLTTGATYVVTVQAIDGQGNTSVKSDPASATVEDQNTPSAPQAFTTSTDETYHVTVSWTPVTTNTAGDPSADPIAPRIRDLAGYRLYADVTSPPGAVVADRGVLGPSFVPPYYETPVLACRERFYMLTAVDTCGRESAPTPISRGVAVNSGVLPKSPTNLQAQYVEPGKARIKWRPVTHDLDNKGIKVEKYQIWRSVPIRGEEPETSASWSADPIGEATSGSYTDGGIPPMGLGDVVWYRVNAVDACGNSSDESSPTKLECAFSGDVEIVTPMNGQSVSNGVPVTVRVVGGTDLYYDNVTIVYVLNGTEKRTFTSTSHGTSWTDGGWTVDSSSSGEYTITASVSNTAGCKQFATVEVTATYVPAPH